MSIVDNTAELRAEVERLQRHAAGLEEVVKHLLQYKALADEASRWVEMVHIWSPSLTDHNEAAEWLDHHAALKETHPTGERPDPALQPHRYKAALNGVHCDVCSCEKGHSVHWNEEYEHE